MVMVKNYREAGFSSVLEELQWRGLINNTTDLEHLGEQLRAPITFYAGFDPTAPSLHIGNLVTLIVMRHLQLAGHRPCVLIGGSTGLIGDPRQSGERVLQDKEVVLSWVRKLATQIARILPSQLPHNDDANSNVCESTQESSDQSYTNSCGKTAFHKEGSSQIDDNAHTQDADSPLAFM